MTIYQARVQGLYNSALEWSFGFHFESTSDATTCASTLAAGFTTFWTAATNGYENYASSVVTVTNAQIRTLNSSLRTLTVTNSGLSLAGTAASAILPVQLAPVVSQYNPSFDDKSHRGHFHLPAPSSSTLNNGKWASAFLTSLGVDVQALFDEMNTLGAFQVTSYNRRTNKLGEAPFTKHILTNWNIPDKPGTARQRARKEAVTRTTTGTLS